MRSTTVKRKTAETDITLTLSLDGTGKSKICSGCGFLDHMLTLFAKHGRFDLTLNCVGDTQVDYHHSVEDIGICLGRAINECLGEKKGIVRYGSMMLPMDEALILTSLDISGRAYLNFDCRFNTEKIGAFDTELVKEFFWGVVRSADMTLHIKKLDGENSHHVAEGIFKSFARALSAAVAVDERLGGEIPSSKGVI